jgi:hypothetical protein
MGRLYKTIKKEPHRPTKEGNGLNLSPFSGSHATARAIAEQLGVGQATVRRAEKFADAVETLQEISPQAAERVLRGEVRDALVANSQNPAAFSRQGWRAGSAAGYLKEALRLQSSYLRCQFQSELPKP